MFRRLWYLSSAIPADMTLQDSLSCLFSGLNALKNNQKNPRSLHVLSLKDDGNAKSDLSLSQLLQLPYLALEENEKISRQRQE